MFGMVWFEYFLGDVVVGGCSRGGSVRRLRVLVEELCSALAAFDPALVPADECARLAEVLTRATKLCDTSRARAAARAVECGARGDAGDASAVEWLARVGGSSTGAVRAA